MAAELPTVIEEELLCCPLCMRSCIEPKVLPCLHTFCRACLDKHLHLKHKPPIPAKPLQFTNTGIHSNRTSPHTQPNTGKKSSGKPSLMSNGSDDGQDGGGSEKESELESSIPKEPAPVPHRTNNRHEIQHVLYEEYDLYEDVDSHSNHPDLQNMYEEPKEADSITSTPTKPDSLTTSTPTKPVKEQEEVVVERKLSPTKIPNSPSVGRIVNNFFKRFPGRKSKEEKANLSESKGINLPEKIPTGIRAKQPPPPPKGLQLARRPVPLPPPDVILGDPSIQNKVKLQTDCESFHSDDSYSVPTDPIGFLTDDHYTPPPELMVGGSREADDSSYLSATDTSSMSISLVQTDEDEYLAPTPTPTLSHSTTSPFPGDQPASDTLTQGRRNKSPLPPLPPTPQQPTFDKINPPETNISSSGEDHNKPPQEAKCEGQSSQVTISGNPAIVRPTKRSPCPNIDLDTKAPSDVWSNCPTCDSSFQLPGAGIKGLQNNSFLTRLQEVVLSQSNAEKKCNNCDTTSAKYRCLDCRHYLCGGCRDAHNWLKITKNHRVMTLGELRSGRYQRELTQKQEIKCEIHKGNAVELMCLFCDKPICYECKLNGHADHRSGSLEDAAERDRDLIISLKQTVVQAKQQFDETGQRLSEYDKQCRNEKQELVDYLQHQKDAMVTRISECFMDLVEEIDKAYTEELAFKDKVASKIAANVSHMKHSCDLAEQLLAHGKTEDILLMSKMIKVNLNNFSFSVPYVLDTRPFVQYSPTSFNKQSMVSLFGRLARRRHSVARLKRPERQLPHAVTVDVGQHKNIQQLQSFRAKTVEDSLGCKPTGMTISTSDDIILVDDINKKIKAYGPSGIVKLDICPLGENALIDPWDVTITYQGHLAVTDRGARKVKVFDANGRLVTQFGPHLKSPWGIAANSFGYLIVSDILAKTVFVNDQDGNLLYPIECKGHDKLFICPEYVTINHNDDIIVSDFKKHCLTVFDSQGRFLYQYGTRGTGPQEFDVPLGVCVDKKGNILAVDYSNRRIHLLSRDGQFERFLLTAEQGLLTPQTIAVNSQGQVVVADGTHVKVFGVHGEDDEADDEGEGNKIYEPLKFYNKIYEEELVRFSRIEEESEA